MILILSGSTVQYLIPLRDFHIICMHIMVTKVFFQDFNYSGVRANVKYQNKRGVGRKHKTM